MVWISLTSPYFLTLHGIKLSLAAFDFHTYVRQHFERLVS